MVWDSRSALSPNQDDASVQSCDASPADGGPAAAGDDDIAASPVSTGHSSDGSGRLQPWRADVTHHQHQQQQQSDWLLDLAPSGQSSRRSSTQSTTTVNSDAPNP